MINYVKLEAINGIASIDSKLNNDINIITGINGCGKTTALKLIWYAVSSNLERLFHECNFKHLHIETKDGVIDILPKYDEKSKPESVIVDSKIADEVFKKEIPYKEYAKSIEELNQMWLNNLGPTVMFPTFRRIEGGFTLNAKEDRNPRTNADHYSMQIQMGLEQTALRLGVRQHNFVTSISTRDLKQYVTSAYADISKSTNRLHVRLKTKLSEILDLANTSSAEDKLGKIHSQLNDISSHHERLLKPFTVLNDLVAKIFIHKGIKLTDGMKLGDVGEVIDSDVLSSGEKQMLSFLCYNAFTKNGLVVIDEPELSLHIDWQRILVETLINQNGSNQFIMATHSPMIYGKYEDKEILMKACE